MLQARSVTRRAAIRAAVAALLALALAGGGLAVSVLTASVSANPDHEAEAPVSALVSPAATSPAGKHSPAARHSPGQANQAAGLPADGIQTAWMMTRDALSAMMSDPGLRPGLSHAHIYELLNPGEKPLPGLAAVPVVDVTSLATLRTAIAKHLLPSGTAAILYDCEDWSFTPVSEQRNPVQAAAQAASLAHSHGLEFIAAPALDLMKVVASGTSADDWQLYIRRGLAGSMAKFSDMVELQAQSLERHPGTYSAFVQQAGAQARAVNPGITVLAGLSTNPPGPGVSAGTLGGAIGVSHSSVDGYWLNIPDPGPYCPGCGAAQPDIGTTLLSDVL